jgi:hypothetical protein
MNLMNIKLGDRVRITFEGDVDAVTDHEVTVFEDDGTFSYWDSRDLDFNITILSHRVPEIEELVDGIEAD